MVFWDKACSICSISHTHRPGHYNDVITSFSNHQPHNCLLVVYSGAHQRKHHGSTSLAFAKNSPMTGEFPAQRASNAENVSFLIGYHRWTTVSQMCFVYSVTVLPNVKDRVEMVITLIHETCARVMKYVASTLVRKVITEIVNNSHRLWLSIWEYEICPLLVMLLFCDSHLLVILS